MLLDERGSKALFTAVGIPVPVSVTVWPGDSPSPDFPLPWILKSQVLSGGRGKAGAIRLVESQEALGPAMESLFSLPVAGKLPPCLLLEQTARIEREFYLSFAVSRDRESLVLTAKPAGGVDVEAGGPGGTLIQNVRLPGGPTQTQIRAAFFRLGLQKAHFAQFSAIVSALFRAVMDNGLLLAEINPLALVVDSALQALDGKAEIDDSLADIRPELLKHHNPLHLSLKELTTSQAGFTYVPLPGWVGCVVNGAGLAMATMDALNFAGLPAANFLDLGGAADEARIRAALTLLFEEPRVNAVFINLYGGILSCAKVAVSLLAVLGGDPPAKPVVARLAGYESRQGLELLRAGRIENLHLVRDMAQALEVLETIGPKGQPAVIENLGPPAEADTGPIPPSAPSHTSGRNALAAPGLSPERALLPLPGLSPEHTIRAAPGLSPQNALPLLPGHFPGRARTPSPLDLGSQTQVLVQGLTGKTGAFHAGLMRAYGTRVVAGVTPFKGGTLVDGAPVYDSVHEAVGNHAIGLSVIFVPGAFAAEAIIEAAEAGIPWIVCITEGIPQLDMLAALPALRDTGACLLGPNTPGIIVPGRFKAGIMPTDPFRPGSIAVFSRSGTLTYEASARLSAAGLGQAVAVGVGGDPFIGAGFRGLLEAVRDDTRVEAVLLLGEIGGRAEEDVADYVARTGFPKPVASFVAGLTAPPGRRMGHAGAILEEGGGVGRKLSALRRAGIEICPSLDSVPHVMRKLLEEWGEPPAA